VMGDDDSGDADALQMFTGWLKSPGKGFSQLLFGLGVWGIALGIINLVWGAVVMGERKVIWAGWLTMGKLWEEPYTEFEGIFASFRPYSDTVFMAMGVVALLWGAHGINQRFEGGFQGWLRGLASDSMWTSLVSSEGKGGWTMTFSAWCLMAGFGFYLWWGIVYWGWVDIGVYAVSAPLLAFGFALRFAAYAEAAESADASD